MPELRALVERHEGKPFAIVGVNSFDSKQDYEKGIEQFELTWISAFQGPDVAPISDLFRVTGYPTVLLIDHTGKIRFRGHFLEGEQQGLLDELVAAAEKAGGE